MKKLLVIAVLSAVLVAGGVFAFAGVSHAADATTGTAPTTFIGRCADAIAGVLGLDRTAIMTRRHNGESLSAIATSQGVDEQKLVDGLKAQQVARINAMVAAGRLTQAQADAYIANLDSTIKANVERTTVGPAGAGLGMMGGRFGMGGGLNFGGGCGGFGRGRGQAGQNGQAPSQGTR